MELDELQRWIAHAVQQRRAIDGDSPFSRLALEHFTGGEHLSPMAQLEIYRRQFWLRHTASLVEDFPGVGAILGQRDWERLTEEYLEAYPPATFSLRDVGAHLPEFVAEGADWLPNRALVLDMARLEWAYVEVFDAEDRGPIAPERLARLDETAWSRARLTLSPTLRLLRVQYPVVELHRRLGQEKNPLVTPPERDPRQLVIHRSDLTIRTEPLEEPPFALLEALNRGATLPEALEVACRCDVEATASISEKMGIWFEDWVRRGWIADVSG